MFADARADSPLESRSRWRLHTQGLPPPDLQVTICDEHGRDAGARQDGGDRRWQRARARAFAAAGAALDSSTIAGIVLTSSVTYSRSQPAVPTLPLMDVRVPVLVMHHKRDACKDCDPREAHLITERLTGAPVKKLSAQITSLPSPSSRSIRCEPRKPAPPVTRIFCIRPEYRASIERPVCPACRNDGD